MVRIHPQDVASHFILTAYCVLLTACAGCAHLPLDPHYAGPQPLPNDIAAYYAYPHQPTDVTTKLLSDRPTFRVSLVQFPLAVEGFTPTEPVVEFEWYESKEPGRRPAILFNPILGGDYPLERNVCVFFADRGFHVALIHRKTIKISPTQPVDHVELLLRQGVLRIRQVVDWMEQQPRVDGERMASFGISMGGIAGVITAALEPRLKAHVALLAGGGIADILVMSHDKLLAKPRAKYLAANHLDLKTLDTLLRQAIKTDPLRLAPYVDARHVLMSMALMDRTVCVPNALRLWRALGRPELLVVPLGHYTSYLFLPYIEYASLKFLRKQLALP